jgi:DNA mismatch repair ATPase MutS
VTVPAVFLVRVGKFYELYGDDARAVGAGLGLRIEEMRRGMAGVAGFPEWMRDRYVDRILAAGKDLAVMEENGPGEFVAERYVSRIFLREGESCVK